MASLETFKYQPREPERTKEEFIEACRKYFQKTPDAKSIYIRAYIPYFNDGDPCEFAIYHVEKNRPTDIDDMDDDWNPEEEKKLKWLFDFEETLQRMFGDHFEVVITNKLNVTHTEYEDHD